VKRLAAWWWVIIPAVAAVLGYFGGALDASEALGIAIGAPLAIVGFGSLLLTIVGMLIEKKKRQ
jgi:hypothetical protein